MPPSPPRPHRTARPGPGRATGPPHSPLIRDLLASGGQAFSFEFMPPKTEAEEAQLWRAIRQLEPLRPTFVSVTYGAGGSTRDRTVRVTGRIAEEIVAVEVPAGDVHHAVEHATHDLSERVKIPGFRPGKVPMPVLISKVGKQRVYAEAIESHIGTWFWSAASRERVRPAEHPAYDYELPATDAEAWSFTAEFAVQSIRTWLDRSGRPRYTSMRELMITADCGGSNSARSRLWKVELQKLADEIAMPIKVCHYPPGTSKWNKIEHRLFCHITQTWRGTPLTSLSAVVELVASTTTRTGLTVRCELDSRRYPKGIKVSDDEMASININGDAFHPEWNHTISPRVPP